MNRTEMKAIKRGIMKLKKVRSIPVKEISRNNVKEYLVTFTAKVEIYFTRLMFRCCFPVIGKYIGNFKPSKPLLYSFLIFGFLKSKIQQRIEKKY